MISIEHILGCAVWIAPCLGACVAVVAACVTSDENEEGEVTE